MRFAPISLALALTLGAGAALAAKPVCHDAAGKDVKCGAASSQTPAARAASSAAKPTAAEVGTPAGAIAKCNDGTTWTSNIPHAACSGHGGVAKWR